MSGQIDAAMITYYRAVLTGQESGCTLRTRVKSEGSPQ
jgi:hypothetical protein